jgi:hypothetical protein
MTTALPVSGRTILTTLPGQMGTWTREGSGCTNTGFAKHKFAPGEALYFRHQDAWHRGYIVRHQPRPWKPRYWLVKTTTTSGSVDDHQSLYFIAHAGGLIPAQFIVFILH